MSCLRIQISTIQNLLRFVSLHIGKQGFHQFCRMAVQTQITLGGIAVHNILIGVDIMHLTEFQLGIRNLLNEPLNGFHIKTNGYTSAVVRITSPLCQIVVRLGKTGNIRHQIFIPFYMFDHFINEVHNKFPICQATKGLITIYSRTGKHNLNGAVAGDMQKSLAFIGVVLFIDIR